MAKDSKTTQKVFSGKKEIGYVYQDPEDNSWGSVCHISEIGHSMIESKQEAIEDVLEIFREVTQERRQKISKLLKEEEEWGNNYQ